MVDSRARSEVFALETQFPRIPGDVRTMETWPFPVPYHVVAGASPRKIPKVFWTNSK
jgi:hypothetical protein